MVHNFMCKVTLLLTSSPNVTISVSTPLLRAVRLIALLNQAWNAVLKATVKCASGKTREIQMKILVSKGFTICYY